MANITETQLETLLVMLKSNIGLYTDYMDQEAKEQKIAELTQYIQSSAIYIEREGITLDLDDIGDCNLVVMYSNWLYDRRKDGVSIMPRMLRWNLNNRLFSEKAKAV